MSAERPTAWLPHSIAEAASATPASGDVDLAAAWSHLMRRLDNAAQIVKSDPASRNPIDLAAGMRHLLVLLAAGIDEALRFDPDPILCVQRASTNDVVTWEWNVRTACIPVPRCAVVRVIACSVTVALPGM